MIPPVLSPFPFIPSVVEFLSPLGVVSPFLDSQNKIVEDDTASDPHNGPKMLVVSVYLDTKLE
jgi:hypothetical protein